MSLSLKQLRQKPKHIRDNIAFGAAAGVTTIVALAVLLTGSYGGGGTLSQEDQQTEAAPAFSTLINQVREQTAGVTNAIRTQTESLVSETQTATNTLDIRGFVATSSNPVAEREAAIMVVPSATSSVEGVTATTSPVIY